MGLLVLTCLIKCLDETCWTSNSNPCQEFLRLRVMLCHHHQHGLHGLCKITHEVWVMLVRVPGKAVNDLPLWPNDHSLTLGVGDEMKVLRHWRKTRNLSSRGLQDTMHWLHITNTIVHNEKNLGDLHHWHCFFHQGIPALISQHPSVGTLRMFKLQTLDYHWKRGLTNHYVNLKKWQVLTLILITIWLTNMIVKEILNFAHQCRQGSKIKGAVFLKNPSRVSWREGTTMHSLISNLTELGCTLGQCCSQMFLQCNRCRRHHHWKRTMNMKAAKKKCKNSFHMADLRSWCLSTKF